MKTFKTLLIATGGIVLFLKINHQWLSQLTWLGTGYGKIYKNIYHDLSFKYYPNWSEEDSQLSSTIVLLVETIEGHASIVVGVTHQEYESIENYDESFISELGFITR